MSMSNEYIIDRIDEATRVNRDAKQVCNDALSLARGRIQQMQRKIENLEFKADMWKTAYEKLSEKYSDKGQATDGCEDRWIPCSERLPYNYADVLIQIEYNNKCRNDIRVGYHSMERKSWFMGDLAGAHKLIEDGLVVAWRPLPEDYVEPVVEDETVEEVICTGDFVLCVNKAGIKINAIYLSKDDEHYWILDNNCEVPQHLYKNQWKLIKYHGHMSVVDWLNAEPVS